MSVSVFKVQKLPIVKTGLNLTMLSSIDFEKYIKVMQM